MKFVIQRVTKAKCEVNHEIRKKLGALGYDIK